MKKIALALWLALLCLTHPSLAQETKPSIDSKEEASPSKLSKKEVTTGMSQIWCHKMEECAKDKSMSTKECEKVLSKNFKEGFDNIPAGRSVNVTRESFDQCKKSIEGGSCDTLKAAHSLPGCDFISLLNRP